MCKTADHVVAFCDIKLTISGAKYVVENTHFS
jgi:hypothetical protein